MIKNYPGIDESNHGKYPEIFVAAHSEIESDLHEERYDKIRENTNILQLPGKKNI